MVLHNHETHGPVFPLQREHGVNAPFPTILAMQVKQSSIHPVEPLYCSRPS